MLGVCASQVSAGLALYHLEAHGPTVGIFSPLKARKPHSRARKAIGEGIRNGCSIAKLPLSGCDRFEHFSPRPDIAVFIVDLCLWRKVQIGRAGCLRIVNITTAAEFPSGTTENTKIRRGEIFVFSAFSVFSNCRI